MKHDGPGSGGRPDTKYITFKDALVSLPDTACVNYGIILDPASIPQPFPETNLGFSTKYKISKIPPIREIAIEIQKKTEIGFSEKAWEKKHFSFYFQRIIDFRTSLAYRLRNSPLGRSQLLTLPLHPVATGIASSPVGHSAGRQLGCPTRRDCIP